MLALLYITLPPVCLSTGSCGATHRSTFMAMRWEFRSRIAAVCSTWTGAGADETQ